MWKDSTGEEIGLFDDIFRSIAAQTWCGTSAAERNGWPAKY